MRLKIELMRARIFLCVSFTSANCRHLGYRTLSYLRSRSLIEQLPQKATQVQEKTEMPFRNLLRIFCIIFFKTFCSVFAKSSHFHSWTICSHENMSTCCPLSSDISIVHFETIYPQLFNFMCNIKLPKFRADW